MKKLLSFYILYFVTFSVYAQTCPPANQLLVKRATGQYDVVPPPGWLVVNEKRSRYVNNFEFLIAAWGDHKHSNDSVRCHYYTMRNMNNHIQLETKERIPESKIISNPNWVMPTND